MAQIVLGVSGGIAAYKALDLLRIMQRHGHTVDVVMTDAAQRFIGPASFAALSGRPVGVRLFERPDQPGYHHLDFMDGADLLLVAPASANTIARMAAGLADGLLASCYLAFEGPVLVAPAMNTRMYLHPATHANLETLGARGVEVIDPESGLLADGDVGIGRLAAPAVIADAVEARLALGRDLAGRIVVVTAGGTREPVDAVRFLGNRSSGRMGWAIAEAARMRGARVRVIAANVELPRSRGIEYVEAPTAAAMREATLAAFEDADAVVMAAAVADYRPATARDGKMDKTAADSLNLELERTDDILAELGSRRSRQVLVGFAAEHGEAGLERAREKRVRKGTNILVHNDVSESGVGFGADDNRITIIGPDGEEHALPRMSKRECARHILDAVVGALPGPGPSSRDGLPLSS
jgi:phosphopantothenoylcysteine decarboxylase / phosphopantothenate---cysteine ligase